MCSSDLNRPEGQRSIRIDIDAAEMRRFAADVGVVADAKAATRDLLAAVSRAGYTRQKGRRAAIREAQPAALIVWSLRKRRQEILKK